MLESLIAISTGLELASGFIGGALGASANRRAARANMQAISQEKAWNIGVMRQNKADVLQQNFLSAYASGVESGTGSTRAVIENNQRVLEDEIRFRESQYDIAYANAKAQSKQKYLGIF